MSILKVDEKQEVFFILLLVVVGRWVIDLLSDGKHIINRLIKHKSPMGLLRAVFLEKQQNTLLRIPVKRIIINREGEIISHELHPPFSYLSTLITQKNRENEEGYGSEFVTLGAQ